MKFIRNLPLAVSGLTLAILSLGKIFTGFKSINIVIGSFLILLILLKFILYNDSFKSELDNVVALSSFGTFSMALMLLSTYLAGIFPHLINFVFGVWIFGILGHIILIVVFTKKYVLDSFDITSVFATWWIVYIGITMAAITAPAFNLSEYGYIFSIFGFVMMIPTFILISYRYIKFNEISDENKPFLCIYTALLSIIIVGYVNSFTINAKFLIGIYILACIFYIFSIYHAIKYLLIEELKFTPSFSAFTFPFVISTIASIESYKFIGLTMINYISHIQSIIALILVIFVSYKYLEFIYLQLIR